MNVVITDQEAFVWKDDIVKVGYKLYSDTFQEMYSEVTFSFAKCVRNTNVLGAVHVKYQ
jgi:hypothetical protein